MALNSYYGGFILTTGPALPYFFTVSVGEPFLTGAFFLRVLLSWDALFLKSLPRPLFSNPFFFYLGPLFSGP